MIKTKTLCVFSVLAVYLPLTLMLCATLACASPAPPGGGGRKTAQAQTGGETSAPELYFTGSGGRGMRLGIIVPESEGLNDNQAYLPAMVQGVLVSAISKYSAISVLDRVSLDRVIAETMDPTYEDNLDIVRLGHVAQAGYMMTGKIMRTTTGYTLQINVSDTSPNAKTIASYSGTSTVAAFDDHTAIQKASQELLTQMGVRLTNTAKAELSATGSQQSIAAEAALARGITAQKQGTEVAALSYYFQAATFDPSLLEAANRASVLSANITSGNIGANVRNDIQWRRDWVARLTETENSFYKMINAADPPYTLFYSTAIETGVVNYQTETVNLSIPINLRGNWVWINSVQRALQVVYDGLNATNRKNDWGLGNWPAQGVSNTNPFSSRKQYDITVEFELVNEQNQVIGRQTAILRPTFSFSGWGTRVSINYDENDFKTIAFNAVKADDITDNLTIRIASVNGAAPENARFQITALSGQVWQEYRNGHTFPVRVENGAAMGFSPSISDNQIRQYRNLVLYTELWGEPVTITSIGKEAFKNKQLTSVIIPDSVTSIEDFAFNNNQLTSIKIPDSVRSIGEAAFQGNKITRITIGRNVRLGIDRGEGSYYSLSLNEGKIKGWFDSTYIGKYSRRAGTYIAKKSGLFFNFILE